MDREIEIDRYRATVERDPQCEPPWKPGWQFPPVLLFRSPLPAGKFPEGGATHQFPNGGDPWSQVGECGGWDLEGPLGMVDESRLAEDVVASAVLEAAGVYDEDYEDFLEAEGFCMDRNWNDPYTITGVVVKTLAEGRPGVWSLGVSEYLNRLGAIYDAIGVPNARFPIETSVGRSEALLVLTEEWLAQNAGPNPNIENVLSVEATKAHRRIERYVEGDVFRSWIVEPDGTKVLCPGIYGEEDIDARVRDMVEYLKHRKPEESPGLSSSAGMEP